MKLKQENTAKPCGCTHTHTQCKLISQKNIDFEAMTNSLLIMHKNNGKN